MRRMEQLDPEAPIERGYLCEIFDSPRYMVLPADIRAEQLQYILLHYMEHVHTNGWDSAHPGVAPAPFIRRGRIRGLPDVTVMEEAEAEASVVRSRRHDGDTPAAIVRPACIEAKAGTRPEQVLHLKFYNEAIAHLDAILGQLEDAEEAASRLIAELRFVSSACARSHAKVL